MKNKKLLYTLIPLGIITILLVGAFFCIRNCIRNYPETIKSSRFCIEGLFPLPQLYEIRSDIPSTIEIGKKTTILKNVDIFAKEICFTPITLLTQDKTYSIDISFMNLFERNLPLTVAQYPEVRGLHTEEEIPNNHILQYEIEYTEDLLDYYLLSEESATECQKEENYILCDTEYLELDPGKTYNLSLISKYGDSIIDSLGEIKTTILDSIKIISSSIKNNSVINTTSIPEITITLNKEIVDIPEVIITDQKNNKINNSVLIEGKNILIKPGTKFLQNTKYSLKIEELRGADGSQLNENFILTFSINDGPEITSTNIYSSSFSVSGNILLNFDQNIKKQNIKDYIKLNSGSEYSYSINDNTVAINPTSNLTACRTHTLTINKGLIGTTNLISTKSYSYRISRQCKRTISIGKSVQGRSIYATYFGYGSKKIVFFAAMHGSEANTKSTLNKLIADIDSYRSKIPTDKTIIIIPTLNPDGIANKSRFNAHGVDLNRNFDSSTWVSGTYFLKNYYPTGGGAYPFSEPESIAIRNLLLRENPYLTISYHSAAGYVIPTNTSRGRNAADMYAALSGYTYTPPGTEGDFSYDITGTFEEWAQEHGYSGMVIELSNAYLDQYTQNRDAMWEMIKY